MGARLPQLAFPAVFERRLLIVSGKGGVGKSAVAASVALAAAQAGKRVLAMGMVDGLGLGLHLGVEELHHDPIRTTAGVMAATIDRPRALDEYLKLQLRVPKAAPTKQLTKALAVLVETAPAIREVVSMGKPIYEAGLPDWDLVVIDAPPLGQLISYLRAPVTLEGLLPRGIVQRQATFMRRFLASPMRSGLVLVTIPEELPIVETIQSLDQLANEPLIDLALVVANRVLPELDVDPNVIGSVENDDLRLAAMRHQTLFAHQQYWLDALDGAKVLPNLFGLLTPGEVSARLSSVWNVSE